MKKIITTIFSLILFIFIFTTTISASSYDVKITASALNVRTGAGTSYARVGSLPRDKTVTVYDESNGWLKIKYNNQYRWICDDYTTKLAPTPSETTAAGKIQITATVLNVRKDAGTSHKIVSIVKKNSIHSYTATKKVGATTWYKISSGWVSGQYVKTPAATTTTVAPTTQKKFTLSASHRDYIERVVAAEARGEKYGGKVVGKWGTTYKGMVAVAQVIHDRAAHPSSWKNTPYGVASSKGQFASPYKGKVSKEVKAAVSAVFDYGYRATEKPLYYFCTKNCYPSWAKKKTLVTTIGNHKFYR